MMPYVFRRLFLVFPTLFFILLINFFLVQITPGGPIDQMIAKASGMVEGRLSDNLIDSGADSSSSYRGARGLPQEFIQELEKQYGFDKPPLERFFLMVKSYLTFDFGSSYFRQISVWELIKEKLPVSLSLGFWSTLLIYLISIPLGVFKAVRDGSRFDTISSIVMVFLYAIPSFLFALLLIILLAGGSYLDWFPLRGLSSDDWESLTFFHKITDYLWHLCLPIVSIVICGLASVTLLTKNSFIEEIQKQYVITARSKGLDRKAILYNHIFRNAMLPLVARFPSAFITIFFTSNLLIEIIFSLDGLGFLGFEAAVNRDYPVMFGTLYIFTLLSLCLHVVGDLLYSIIDPRINFEKED
ncbi:MAG: microcin ABC transporter permease [Alphaproteobacteria bacterium RIFCSPHIGHO2_01_FULL_41_14]|nr:MAG: microcin ABC transporter permease [Alphaproteobacteria bacterium GWB1_45_5]OFW75862.1 MAG: microcin ABC transporter permease [Alphaproteobacteria bacterium GWA1_45_9]OFW89951.1 MAG: microcin ABC transporter permease [Alphaproteobacteria bacterium RIFCSPHIGHO2_01_FULL_41_14]HCI48391.1 microcin ABC transporter permease [Holosporales bacterium]